MKRLASATVLASLLCITGTAPAHVERPAYWPDPAPDTSITPATGGAVPKVKSLRSALKVKPPGETHVVCQPNSMQLLKESIKRARTQGFEIRPSDKRELKKRK